MGVDLEKIELSAGLYEDDEGLPISAGKIRELIAEIRELRLQVQRLSDCTVEDQLQTLNEQLVDVTADLAALRAAVREKVEQILTWDYSIDDSDGPDNLIYSIQQALRGLLADARFFPQEEPK